jgi:hypothetical protein
MSGACLSAISGCRVGVPPVPVVGPPPAAISGNRPPTVKIAADVTTVEAGRRVTLTAEVYDADSDPLTLQWSAPSGTFNNAAGSRTYWTAPATPGPVTITFSADDGRGGITKETVIVTVTGS